MVRAILLVKAKVAIVGVGNCASALVQGVHYYHDADISEPIGLTSYDLGGLKPEDIEIVAAFDLNAKKVNKDLSDAIFEEPNNLPKICGVPHLGVPVQMGRRLDGVGKYVERVVKISEAKPVDVAQHLRDTDTEIVINYLPVGSGKATRYYADEALKAGCGFINAMPVFIASDMAWQSRFESKGLPVAGDDVMSQLGATVLHKTLVKLFVDRGVKVDETYQLNLGGDTDFLNMLEEARLVDKRVSKTSAVKAMAPYEIPTRIGPSDYVDFLCNDKICYIWLKGRYFGGASVTLDVKLHVVDAYNSAGIMVDAIRATKIALDRDIAGPLISVSAYCFKHPPRQMPYSEAKKSFLDFVEGKKDR